MQMTPGGLVEHRAFDTADGLYDCCWSEENENILVSACGDGSIKVWDVAAPPAANPLRSFQEHTHEVGVGGGAGGVRGWVLVVCVGGFWWSEAVGLLRVGLLVAGGLRVWGWVLVGCGCGCL